MELRKDPITRSWVVIREGGEHALSSETCPFCPGNEHLTPPALLTLPAGPAPWQVRAFPHFDPLFRIEGATDRAAEGLYDRMAAVGAHELVVELPEHERRLSNATDEELTRVLDAYAQRLSDLKKDERIKYVAISKDTAGVNGRRVVHSHAQVTGTAFVPRRILSELRSAREYFQLKERCLFCDMLRQELKQAARVVEATKSFAVFCPYASRTPYETWLVPRRHHHSFEEDYPASSQQVELARLLRRTLRRLESLAEGYRLALHTAPNTIASQGRIGFWRSLEEDYHWHIELMPVLAAEPDPHLANEVYFTNVAPETAAAKLRALPAGE